MLCHFDPSVMRIRRMPPPLSGCWGQKGVRHLPPLKGEVPRRGGGVSWETIEGKFVLKFGSLTPPRPVLRTGQPPLSGGPGDLLTSTSFQGRPWLFDPGILSKGDRVHPAPYPFPQTTCRLRHQCRGHNACRLPDAPCPGYSQGRRFYSHRIWRSCSFHIPDWVPE